MTYLELKNLIEQLEQEQLEQDVTIYIASKDEYKAVTEGAIAQEDDVLDIGHFFIVTN